jgi:hypothetical protein
LLERTKYTACYHAGTVPKRRLKAVFLRFAQTVAAQGNKTGFCPGAAKAAGVFAPRGPLCFNFETETQPAARFVSKLKQKQGILLVCAPLFVSKLKQPT